MGPGRRVVGRPSPPAAGELRATSGSYRVGLELVAAGQLADHGLDPAALADQPGRRPGRAPTQQRLQRWLPLTVRRWRQRDTAQQRVAVGALQQREHPPQRGPVRGNRLRHRLHRPGARANVLDRPQPGGRVDLAEVGRDTLGIHVPDQAGPDVDGSEAYARSR